MQTSMFYEKAITWLIVGELGKDEFKMCLSWLYDTYHNIMQH